MFAVHCLGWQMTTGGFVLVLNVFYTGCINHVNVHRPSAG